MPARRAGLKILFNLQYLILRLFFFPQLRTLFLFHCKSNMPEFTVFRGSQNGKIVESRAQRPDPTENEVLVRITHSGLCGTDEHYRHAGIVLGHEGAGFVEAIGNKVTSLKM